MVSAIRRKRVFDDDPVLKHDLPIRAARHFRIVRHQHQCRSRVLLRSSSRSSTSRPFAESRLPVGSSAITIGGLDDKGARQRHALLLAARELHRVMIHALAQTDLIQQRRACFRPLPSTFSSNGSRTFSSAVSVWINWYDWKTNPILRPRTAARSVSARL